MFFSIIKVTLLQTKSTVFRAPLSNFHFVQILTVYVDKSGTAYCCKDLV